MRLKAVLTFSLVSIFFFAFAGSKVESGKISANSKSKAVQVEKSKLPLNKMKKATDVVAPIKNNNTAEVVNVSPTVEVVYMPIFEQSKVKFIKKSSATKETEQ